MIRPSQTRQLGSLLTLQLKTTVFKTNENCNYSSKDNLINSNSSSFVNNLSYFEFFDKSAWFESNALNQMANNCNRFLMHFKVRSIQKSVDKLIAFLSELNILPDVLEISETKLKSNQLTINKDMQGYIFIRKGNSKNSGG